MFRHGAESSNRFEQTFAAKPSWHWNSTLTALEARFVPFHIQVNGFSSSSSSKATPTFNPQLALLQAQRTKSQFLCTLHIDWHIHTYPYNSIHIHTCPYVSLRQVHRPITVTTSDAHMQGWDRLDISPIVQWINWNKSIVAELDLRGPGNNALQFAWSRTGAPLVQAFIFMTLRWLKSLNLTQLGRWW